MTLIESHNTCAHGTGSICIPSLLSDSRLMQNSRGFAIFSDLPGSHDLRHLRKEAFVALQRANQEYRRRRVLPDSDEPNYEEDRKTAARIKRFLSDGGPHLQSMYHDSQLIEFLSLESGLRLSPSGSGGVYIYYVRSGDFIGIHRDAGICDLVLITALYDSSLSDEGGSLILYPGRTSESCKAISATPKRGEKVVKLTAGQSLIMFGGVIPHRVVPVRAEQIRIVSALCYSVKSVL
ncbi:UNVERIFIED_ORG: hypothetical protein J2W82_000198 [Pseudomonas mohnii]|nr:hypothetical protein [Pseudomonas mohnii]